MSCPNPSILILSGPILSVKAPPKKSQEISKQHFCGQPGHTQRIPGDSLRGHRPPDCAGDTRRNRAPLVRADLDGNRHPRATRQIGVRVLFGVGRISSSQCSAATKGAISAFTKSLAIDEATRGVRVNAVLPGNIYTKGRAEAIKAMGENGLVLCQT